MPLWHKWKLSVLRTILQISLLRALRKREQKLWTSVCTEATAGARIRVCIPICNSDSYTDGSDGVFTTFDGFPMTP